MVDIIAKLFSKEESAQSKVNIIADLFKELFNYILKAMDVEEEIA